MKILTAQLNYIVGDFEGNLRKILEALDFARSEKLDGALFSELALCGYPPEDLLLQEGFMEKMEECLEKVILASQDLFVIVGLARKNPSPVGKPLLNSAAIISNGELLGFHDKCRLPTYDVFDESRYFAPGSSAFTWDLKGKRVGVLICEDIWEQSPFFSYIEDPVKDLVDQKIDLLISLSASPFQKGKLDLRFQVARKVVEQLRCPLIFCAQVGGNDQLVFDGRSFLMNEEGKTLSLAKGFEEDLKIWNVDEIKQEILYLESEVKNLSSALILGLKDYFHKSGFQKACIGISGGIDSAVVACIAVEALGKENVLGIYMPSRFSSKESEKDAKDLCLRLGISLKEISIEPVFETYLDLLAPHFENRCFDATEENLQARIRGDLLMAFSNKFGSILLSTGNKSEMAVGFTTLYGDLSGGLSPLSDVTKHKVYELAYFFNEKREVIPLSILQKEPSAELRHGQKDSDALPSYEVLDAIVELFIEEGKSAEMIAEEKEIDLSVVQEIILKIYRAEYKRKQAPPGIRVSSKSLVKGRKMPIVQKWN